MSNGLSDIRKVVVGPGVTVEPGAFSNCVGLESLLSYGTLGEAFEDDCSTLGRLETVTLYGEWIDSSAMFGQGSAVSAVVLPNAARVDCAFGKCGNVRTVCAPAVSGLGREVFRGCGNVSSLSFPKLNQTARWTFRDCSSLTSLTMSLHSGLYGEPFKGCVSLSAIDFVDDGYFPSPDIPIVPLSSTFDDCPRPVSCFIPDDDTVYGRFMTDTNGGCGWKDLVDAGKVVVARRAVEVLSPPRRDPGHYVCYGTSDGKEHRFALSCIPTLDANESLFEDCWDFESAWDVMSSVTSPSGLYDKWDWYYYWPCADGRDCMDHGTDAVFAAVPLRQNDDWDCWDENTFDNVTYVSCGTGCECVMLEERAMWGMVGLKSVDMPTVLSVCDMVFCRCLNLSSVNLTAAEYVGQAAFSCCGMLEDVRLDKACSLQYNAFYQCSNLKHVYIPSVKFIDSCAFPYVKRIECVNFGNSMTETPVGISDFPKIGTCVVPDALYDDFCRYYSRKFENIIKYSDYNLGG